MAWGLLLTGYCCLLADRLCILSGLTLVLLWAYQRGLEFFEYLRIMLFVFVSKPNILSGAGSGLLRVPGQQSWEACFLDDTVPQSHTRYGVSSSVRCSL